MSHIYMWIYNELKVKFENKSLIWRYFSSFSSGRDSSSSSLYPRVLVGNVEINFYNYHRIERREIPKRVKEGSTDFMYYLQFIQSLRSHIYENF